jgi:hypothetical protein
MLQESVRNALGCLDSAPEPFTDGGVYIQFCLSHAALVHVAVYDAKGVLLWRSEGRDLGTGSQQWYFDGTASGLPLPLGSYVYEVTALYAPGNSESRQGSMSRAQADRH